MIFFRIFAESLPKVDAYSVDIRSLFFFCLKILAKILNCIKKLNAYLLILLHFVSFKYWQLYDSFFHLNISVLSSTESSKALSLIAYKHFDNLNTFFSTYIFLTLNTSNCCKKSSTKNKQKKS